MARRPKYKNQILAELQAGADPLELGKRYPVTPSYVYKLAKQVREANRAKFSTEAPVLKAQSVSKTDDKTETKTDTNTRTTAPQSNNRLALVRRLNGGYSMQQSGRAEAFYASPGRPPSPFSQLSVSSLKTSGGDVLEEYLRELQGRRGVQVYKEMGNDAVISAVLSAVKMTLRRVTWYAADNPSKEKSKTAKSGTAKTNPDTGDKDKDWLESCMHDMSLSWSDYIDQALGMIQYGFSVFETVYKLRRGTDYSRPGPKVTRSKYNDGRIGWKKMCFIGQDTLQPGNGWIFDADGSLRGLNQQPPAGAHLRQSKAISIPMEKLVLFRTTVERDNPEGRSLCRAMWKPYYIKSQLEEVEAISAERLGAGFPVFYLGDDVARGDSTDSDIDAFQNMARNIRVDEQMGMVIPYAKMGEGAREGEGVRFELVTPDNKSVVDFSAIIHRYEKRIAMVGLAQFIHLGMDQQGTQALADVTTDFFQLAVSAWADSLEDTINRFMVEPLVALNNMDVATAPIIKHGDISVPDLAVIADYINKTVGAQVIEPDDQLENELRRVAGLPEKDPTTVRSVMNEVDGDGGQRVARSEKAKPVGKGANNQRNQNPTAAKPTPAKRPEAKKPARASEIVEAEEL